MRVSTTMLMRGFLAMAVVGTLYSVGYAVGRTSWQERENAATLAEKMVTRSPDDDVPQDQQRGDRRVRQQMRGSTMGALLSTERASPRVPRFYVPTEIAHVEHGDPRVTMCRLDLDSYWRNPMRTPMFRDLVGMSRCRRVKSGSLNDLVADLARKGIKPIEPTGFVFHESRVGSTLVANMLGSIPTNLVYSESAPPPAIINHCRTCDPEQRTDLLRKLFALMGASPFHERLYFKFQSITVPNIAIISAAFPKTPWIFVYREPVQVIMSHFKKGGTSAPCLREHRRPRHETASILGLDDRAAAAVPPERYCAAHLAMLCASALENDERAGAMALMVNYDALPGALVHYVLPTHFGVSVSKEDADRMLAISTVYSKQRSRPLPSADQAQDVHWEGDSQAKEQAATPKIRQAADDLMRPYFDKLLAATLAKTQGDNLTRFKNLDVPTSVAEAGVGP